MATRTTSELLSPDKTPTIRTDGLTRTFDSLTAVDRLDLEVPINIVYGLLGPSGVSKPTALRMMTTLLAPARDRAMVLGHDVARERHAVRGLIGVAGQYANIDKTLTGSEDLRLFERLLGLGRRRARGRAEELLAAFSLTKVGGKRVSGYSDGMRRRLDLAVSLIFRPPLIFLDEPTAGLNPRACEQMWNVIRSLVRGGSTILLTIQYLGEVDCLAHRVGTIDAGRLIAEGTPDELKDRMGSSSLVLVPVIPEDQAATTAVIGRVTGHVPTTVDQGTRLQTPLNKASVAVEVLVTLRGADPSPRTVLVDRPGMDSVFMTLTEQPIKHGDVASPDATAPSTPSPASSSSRPVDSQEQS